MKIIFWEKRKNIISSQHIVDFSFFTFLHTTVLPCASVWNPWKQFKLALRPQQNYGAHWSQNQNGLTLSVAQMEMVDVNFIEMN